MRSVECVKNLVVAGGIGGDFDHRDQGADCRIVENIFGRGGGDGDAEFWEVAGEFEDFVVFSHQNRDFAGRSAGVEFAADFPDDEIDLGEPRTELRATNFTGKFVVFAGGDQIFVGIETVEISGDGGERGVEDFLSRAVIFSQIYADGVGKSREKFAEIFD